MAVLNTRGYSVLVVGDDDLARKLVHVLGVGRGSLVVASDGSEGLRFLTSPSHDRFSLVLVDLKTIDGLPAVRHLRDYELRSPSGGLPCSRSCRLGQRATHPEPT